MGISKGTSITNISNHKKHLNQFSDECEKSWAKEKLFDENGNSISVTDIAFKIMSEWDGWETSYAAGYLDAMTRIHSPKSKYIAETGDTIIRYFLCNASQFQGLKARAIKKHLKNLLNGKIEVR
ncbi:MAG: hypothetical protein WC860_08930 [Candidatus Margulisiibacteriota bacterium]|jgi:hypothetical protein